MRKILTIATMMSLGLLSNLNAAGTTASTSISNTSVLNYKIGGTTQTTIEATDTFVVDRKIDVKVASTDTDKTISVSAGTAEQILTYTIVNTGNDTETFDLSVAQKTSDYLAGGCTVSDGTNNITSISLNTDATQTLTVSCSIPETATDKQTSSIWLVATINGRIKENNDADNPNVVQNIFADSKSRGEYGSDILRDGKHSDIGTFTISSTVLSVEKSSVVTWDPVSKNTKPHRIPGAIVRYCFQVDNTGSENATDVVITDEMSGNGKDNLSYVKSGKISQDIGTPCACAGIADASGTISGTTVSIGLGTVATLTRTCAYIEAEIN